MIPAADLAVHVMRRVRNRKNPGFAYPFGEFDSRSEDIVREPGFPIRHEKLERRPVQTEA